MLHTTTYQLKPYLLIGEAPEKYVKPGTEWIRDAVKGLMHRKSNLLKGEGVNTELFHNHDEKTSITLTGYPKIIYHYTQERFLVTGIKEGAFALERLFEQYPPAVPVDDKMIIGIQQMEENNEEISILDKALLYRTRNYLPFNASVHKAYQKETAAGKMKLLEETIAKHLRNDLFKFLEIDVPSFEVNLLDILKLDQKRLTYKNHHYLPFDLVFSLNVNLPQYLALGNGKAFGYGILEHYIDPER